MRTSSFVYRLLVYSSQPQLPRDLRLQLAPHPFNRNPIDHFLQETLDDHAFGVAAVDAAGHQVEDVLVGDLAGGGAVGAAHIVRLDLQARDAVGAGQLAQHQVAVGLVGVGLLRLRIDLDEALVHRPCPILQRALEQQVAGGVGRLVELVGVMIQVLPAAREVQAQQLAVAARSVQLHVDPVLAQPAAPRADEVAQQAVARQQHPLRAEVPRGVGQVLQVQIVHLAVGARQQLDDAVGHPAVRADEVLHQRHGRAFLGHDDRVVHPRQLAGALADDRLERLLDDDVARHIDERAAVPQRVVQRAELVLVGRHGRAEVALHQLRVLPRGGVQVAEDDPAGGEAGVKLVLCGRAVDDRQRADALDLGQALRHLGRQDRRCGPHR